MKKLQNFYLFSYRLVGFLFLVGLIFSIIWYGFSIIFFVGNSTWSVPMILSPNQEKVLWHLEHVLAFEHEVTKNTAELTAAEQMFHYKQALLSRKQKLLERVKQSMAYQAQQYSKASHEFEQLSAEKSLSLEQLNALNREINQAEQTIDQELKLGLITKQEALLAHFNWQKLYASMIDAKTSMYDLKKRAKFYKDAANTLNGSGKNLSLMTRVIKKSELQGDISQLKSDLFSLQVTIQHLQKNIHKKVAVLKSIKHSPYILATKKLTEVAFVPYTNLKKVNVGAPVYSCYWDMVFCYRSGEILAIYDAEEYAKHPIFKSDIKGQFIGIKFYQAADGHKKLLFLNSKPLLV